MPADAFDDASRRARRCADLLELQADERRTCRVEDDVAAWNAWIRQMRRIDIRDRCISRGARREETFQLAHHILRNGTTGFHGRLQNRIADFRKLSRQDVMAAEYDWRLLFEDDEPERPRTCFWVAERETWGKHGTRGQLIAFASARALVASFDHVRRNTADRRRDELVQLAV